MKKIVVLLVAVVMTVVACTDAKQEALDRVTEVESQIQKQALLGIDTALANKAIAAYQDYYTQFPEDSMSYEYKVRTADILMNVKRYQESIALLDELIALDDAYAFIPKVMLLKAYIYETGVQSYSEAEKAYRALINRYPKHPLAEEARASIELLGMSEAQLLEFLRSKNAEEADSTVAAE